MGAYLTIVNDTPDDWRCKLSYDQKTVKSALSVFTVAAPMVGMVGSFLASGPLAPVMGVIGVVGMMTYSVPETFIKPFMKEIVEEGKVVRTANSTDFNGIVARAVKIRLKEKKYKRIKAHKKKRFGKMPIALWVQATCVKIEEKDATTVSLQAVYMQPIFSGKTPNSDAKHSIKEWLTKKKSTETVEVTGVADPAAEGAAGGEGAAAGGEGAAAGAEGAEAGGEGAAAGGGGAAAGGEGGA